MSSSQYSSALHRSSQGVQLWNPEQTSLTHRVGQLDTIDSEKETHDPCAQALLLTGAPGCPTESATGSRQRNSLQCSLVRQTCQRERPQDKRIQGQAYLQKDTRGEGGSHGVGVCVCVYSAILSHLSWLTIGTANQWAEPPPRPLVQSFATALSLHMDVVNLHAPAEGELHLDDGFGAALRGHGLDIAAGYGCPPSPTTTFSWPCFLH